ncbi:lysophosphatidic acid receptor 6 [Pholidichthys leucotaenia]
MMNVTESNCTDTPASYQYYLFPAVYTIALVIGVPGNLAALFVFAFRITPRTAFSIYISNLALADIIILCVLPFRIHYHINRNNWVFGDAACLITGILYYANIYMSIVFMTCICVDRYMATVHPHKYLRLRHPWYSVIVSGVIWCVGGVAILVFILMGPLGTNKGSSGAQHCFENFTQDEWNKRLKVYTILSLIFGSLLPSMIILVCYPMAAKRISMIRTKTAQKAVRVIYTILAITLVCFLPNHVVYLLHYLDRRGGKGCSVFYDARRVTMALINLNTCLDPILYYVTTNHFKWKCLKMSWLWGTVTRSRGVYTIAVN